MKRIKYAWPVFGICLVGLLAGMGWITHKALSLDADGTQARMDSDLQERTRLALWRLDSAVIPLIVQESARPWHAYKPFMPIEQAFNNDNEILPSGSIRQPSELVMNSTPDILLHFQAVKDGPLTSPQVPNDQERQEVVKFQNGDSLVNKASARLEDLSQTIDAQSLFQLVGDMDMDQPWVETVFTQADTPNQAVQNSLTQRQQKLNIGENNYRNRSSSEAQTRGNNFNSTILLPGAMPVTQNKMQPYWQKNKLLLIKHVSVGGEEYVQGCWLNWPNIREWLLVGLDDLLPGSDLVPINAAQPSTPNEARMATLPIRLLPGKVVAIEDDEPNSLRLMLATAWVCVLAGSAFGAVVLGQAIGLSRRRGAFVSAVTHELRTPLTTFRLYCDMLAGGMVSSDEKRDSYIGRLKAESDRLSHLVENVLAYARLTRPRPAEAMEVLKLDALASRLEGRLSARSNQSSKELVVEIDDSGNDHDNKTVRADVSKLEQILLNLVDNSCKFSARATDNRIHLSFNATAKEGVITIRDHGNGIAKEQLSKLFDGFNRSAHQAAGEAPGIGLGLALSRQLARDMGGNLRYDGSKTDGACFVLTIRLA